MSKQIDERVVEMRFDNAQFEKNVSTTMSTLEKLKQSLNLTGAAKGFEDINAAAKKIDMNGLANSVDTVGLRFNALYTIADQTLRNITNRVEQTITRTLKMLTVEPITTGLNEYELKMGSIQTIMASTGESLGVVNKYLNELNEYSDKTIYSFSDMTQNIGKFTNAGVKLEDAVLAIKGISNEAAVSGANANEASRAMYNFAQALSAGYVKLIDWKSIENANMATVEFKQYLLEAAEAAGTVEKQANGMYKVLSTNAQGSTFDQLIDATHYFNDSLNYQWMTTDALINTLKAYADETTEIGAKAIAAASEVKTLSMLMDTLKEAVQSGWAMTWELIIGDFEEAKAVWTAVSEALTGSIVDIGDSMNVLNTFTLAKTDKDRISAWENLSKAIEKSGTSLGAFQTKVKFVAKSHNIDIDKIIEKYGSLIEAIKAGAVSTDILKESLTSLESAGGIITRMSEARNNLLSGALESKWKKLSRVITESGVSAQTFEDSLRNVLKEHGEDVEYLIEKHGSLEQVFRNESWGVEYLKEALENLNSEVIDLSDVTEGLKMGSKGEDVKKIQQALKDAGYQCGEFGEQLNGVDGIIGKVTENSIKAFQKAKGLRVTGIIDKETLKALEEANKKTIKLQENIDDLVSGIGELGGREVAIEGLKNIFESLKAVFEAVKKAWDNVFKGFKSSDLYNVIVRFRDFTKELKINKDTAEKITNTFEGLFTILKFVKDIVVKVLTVGAKLAWNVFKPLAKATLSATSAMGKFITSAGNSISKVFEPFGKVIESVVKLITTLAETIGTFVSESIDKLSEFEFIKEVGKWFSDVANTISGVIDNITSYLTSIDIHKFIAPFEKIKAYFSSISDWWSSFKASEDGQTIIEGLISPFVMLRDWITDFELPKFDPSKIKLDVFTKKLATFFNFLKDNGYSGIVGGLTGFANYLKTTIDYKWEELQASTLTKFSEFYIKYGDKIKAGFDKCKEVFSSILEFVFGTDKISVKDILSMAEKFLTIMLLVKSLSIVNNIAGTFSDIADTFSNLAKSAKWRSIGAAFVSIGIALGAFAICMKIIETIDPDRATKSMLMLLTALTLMGLIVGGLMFLSSKIGGGIDLVAATTSLVAIAAALAILTYTLKEIDATEFKNLGSSFGILLGVLTSLMLTMAVIGKTCGGANLKTATALIVMLGAMKMLLDILTDYANYDWNSVLHVIPVVATVLAGLGLVLRLATGGLQAGANAGGMGFLVLSIVFSLNTLLHVISELGKMPVQELKQGLAAMTLVLTEMTIMLMMINATSSLTKLNKGQRAISGFTGLATALIAVAATVAILGRQPTEVLLRGGAAVTIILGLFTAMMVAMGRAMRGTTKFGKITGMIIGMGLIIAELTVIMRLLKDIDGVDALAKFGAITAVLISMAGCLRLLTKHQNGAKNIYKWIGAMAVFGLVVAGLATIMWLIQGVDGVNAVAQFGAISMILTIMSLMLEKLTSHSRIQPENIYKWVKAMAAFGLIVAGLAAILWAIQGVDGGNAVAQFTAISVILLAMSGCIKILSTIGPMMSAVYPAIGALAVFIIGLTAIVSAIGALITLIDSKLGEGTSLKALDSAVSALEKIGLALGKFVGGIIGGVGAAIMATLPQMGKDLSDFWTEASTFFDGVSNLKDGVVTNTRLMVSTISELGLLALSNGIDNFFAIGHSLPNLGTDLSNFMTNASRFFEGLGSISADTATGAKSVAESIRILAEAAQTESYTFGDGFASLGEKLVPFGEAMVAFSDTISGKIDAEAVEATANAAGVMAELNSKLPREYGTISGLFTSNPIPLDTFGNQLVMFGKAMVSFSKEVAGKIDADAVNAAASAGEVMAELNSKLPREYGAVSGWFANGPISMDTFGAQLVMFGRAMISFSGIVKGKIDADAVNAAASAGSVMAELANGLPTKYDGIVALFKDSPISLDTFGEQLVQFGRAIVMFSGTVQGRIDQSAVEAAASAGSVMSEMAKSLPADPSVFQKWFGSDNQMSMETFGKQLVKFGESMIDFSKSVSGNVDSNAIKTTMTVANELANLANSMPEAINLTVLKTGLNDLADTMVKFSESVSGNVDTETVTKVVNSARTIAQAAAIMPEQVDLAKLTVGLSDFGDAIVSFSEKVSGAVDGGSVTTAAQAGKDIAAMLATIPQGIDPTVFIDNLGRLGTALTDFSKSVAGSDNSPGLNTYALANAQTACTYISNMLTSLGVYVDLTSFITNAQSLAQAIINFSNTVAGTGGVDLNAVVSASQAGTEIGTMMTSVSGYTDVTEFVNNAAKLAAAIVKFSSDVGGGVIDMTAIANATEAGHKITELIKSSAVYADASSFVDNAGSVAKSIIDFSKTVTDGINYPAISAASLASEEIAKILSELSYIPDISSTVSTIGTLGIAITEFSDTVSDVNMTGLSEDCASFKKIVESFGKLSDSGVKAFIENLSGAKMKTVAAISNFCIAAASGTRSYVYTFKQVGSDLVTGFANGITANTFRAQAAAAAMASAALSAAKKELRSNSPSKAFYDLGTYAGEGFTNAFADYGSASSKAGSGLAKSALLGFRDAISTAKDMVENGIDAQPTIRPVLDLSDITANASKITSLFDMNPSVGVLANVGAISNGMNSGQNGKTNEDVISAINGLKDTLGTKTGDTYTIGNITYDDGSEVSNAIKTLVRAARVERRA